MAYTVPAFARVAADRILTLVQSSLEKVLSKLQLVLDEIDTDITAVESDLSTHTDNLTIHFTEASIDHGSIAGLSDDDHSVYALLAGRSGGQSLIGGTGSGDDLTLSSTSHATKGSILFGSSAYDQLNDRLGIGTTSPSYELDVVGDCRVSNDVIVSGEIFSTIDTSNLRISGGNVDSAGAHLELFGGSHLTASGEMRFDADYYRFRTQAGVPLVEIDGSGNVGIGTTSPNSILEIAMSTENLEFVDSGSTGASGSGSVIDWIEVQVGGNTGYIKVYDAK